MYSDMEFEVTTNSISEKALVVRDPQLVMTIEKWMTRLNSEDRGPNELNYLKLLQRMVENKQMGPPFNKAPPVGPLYPLSKYLNPPPLSCCNYSSNQCASATNECWRANNCGGGSSMPTTTTETEDDDCGTTQTDDSCRSDLKSNTTDYSNAKYDEMKEFGGCGETRHMTKLGSLDSKSEWIKRNGHLQAGGGGECSACWGGKDGGASSGGASKERIITKNSYTTSPSFCNPCLDGYLKKARPGPEPIDQAYAELLGDCALPYITDTEQKTVGNELVNVLENVNDSTSLQDFYFQVALYTCDQASLMMDVADGMMDDFRTLALNVFESRSELISDSLAKEQIELNDVYTYLRHRTLNRAEVAIDFLREHLPSFNWFKYQIAPDLYLKREIQRKVPTAPSIASASGDGSDDCPTHKTTSAIGDDGGATGTSGNGFGVDDDNNDDVNDEGVRQTAMKKMLYTLTLLRTDVRRAECESARLSEQHKELTTNMAETMCRISEAQFRSAAEIERLTCELTTLRQKSSCQTKTVDQLMENIQYAMQNDHPSSQNVC